MNQNIVMESLRNATRERHSLLHRHPLVAELLRGPVSINAYLRVLEAFYGYYEPLEPILVEHSRLVSPDGPYNRTTRTNWLAADLFEFCRDRSRLAAIPRCRELPAFIDDGDFAGCVYVIEGSALGGRVVEKCIRRSREAGIPGSSRFFRGYGAGTRRRWLNICRFLTAICRTRVELENAMIGAERTFVSLSNWLESRSAA